VGLVDALLSVGGFANLVGDLPHSRLTHLLLVRMTLLMILNPDLSLVDCCAFLFLDDFALLGGSNVMNNVAHRLGGMISLWRGWWVRGCWVGVTPTDGERVAPLCSVQSSIGPDFMTPGPTLTPFSLRFTIGRGGHHRQAQ